MKFYSIAVVSAGVLALATTTLHAAPVPGQGTWETTLQARDLDGNPSTIDAWYDTALSITWLADANYAQTSLYDTDGLMTWSEANAWASSLSVGGVSGWRLPTVTDTGGSGCFNFGYSGTDCGYNVDTSTGEMAHMFYATLGDTAYYDTSGVLQSGYGLSNTGPFSNLQPPYGTLPDSTSPLNRNYWTSTADASDGNQAWIFYFGSGYQGAAPTNELSFAWAVHAGDVGTAIVPLPAAIWLFGGGLLGLIGVAGKRQC